MKMGNIVPRAAIEHTSLAFWAFILALHHICFPDGTTVSISTCLCGSLPQRSLQTTTLVPLASFNVYNYNNAMLHIAIFSLVGGVGVRNRPTVKCYVLLLVMKRDTAQ